MSSSSQQNEGTPHRISNARATPTTSTPQTLEQLQQQPQTQDDYKHSTEDELRTATFFVDLTNKEGILNGATTDLVNIVIARLQTTFQGLTLGGVSSVTDPRFPPTPKDEKKSYEPFVHLLNKIIITAEPHISLSLLKGLRFHVLDSEVKEKFGTHKRLKPDIVGIIGELPIPRPTEEISGEGQRIAKRQKVEAKEPDLSWKQVEVVVESKAAIRDMVRQSGTYARCLALSNQRRFFTLGIGFEFKTFNAYVFVFHRAGLSSSDGLNIKETEGFNRLVEHIVAIMSIKDEADYCLDTTRFHDVFLLNGRYFRSVRYLYVRDSLRGRSTFVHRLQELGLEEASACPEMENRQLQLSPGVTRLPDKITYKLSYQIRGHSQEGPLFSQFYGQFGIADIIGYHVCRPEEPHGSTHRLMKGAKFWKLFAQNENSQDRHYEPEDRGLQCIALAGEGTAFIDLDNKEEGIPSPGDLLETVLHAIIGHYNLFKRGILHRDISSGNVMRYIKPIKRPALEEFAFTKDVELCRGFLIDGDHSVKWREPTGTHAISGTMPFMSVRLLTYMGTGETTVPTALDDLESFLWLLIWGIVHASKDIEGAMGANTGIGLMLKSWAGDARRNMTKLVDAQISWKDAVFGDLIREWLNTFNEARDSTSGVMEHLPGIPLDNEEGSEWRNTCDWLESFCQEVYVAILESGFKHLEDVKKYSNWTEVVAATVSLKNRPLVFPTFSYKCEAEEAAVLTDTVP